MKREYPDRPLIGVGAVVWQGERILLVKRARPPLEGLWTLPGGAQEVGETLFEAATREVKEETGIVIDPVGIVTAFDLIERDEVGRIRFHYSIVDIAARYVSGYLRHGDDVDDVKWVMEDDVPALGVWSEVDKVVRLSRKVLRPYAFRAFD